MSGMTQKEVHDLGICCRWYYTLKKMRDLMNRHLLTEAQINATAMTEPLTAVAARGEQAVYRAITDGLDTEIKAIDAGLAQFNKLYGIRAYQMFYAYFIDRKSLDSIAQMQRTSVSSVRRAMRMIGNGHSASQKGGASHNSDN